MKIKIFIISMENAIHRRRNILNQLENINLDYEIINAVNGSLLNESEVVEKCVIEEINKYPRWLTKGAIGCALSHLAVYERIVEEKIDFGIVLEDDAELSSNFEYIINKMIHRNLLLTDTVTLLFTQNIRGEKPIFSTNDEEFIAENVTLNYPKNTNSMTTALGYIVSNQTAINLKKEIFPIHVASDTWHYFLDKKLFLKMNCVLPYIVRPYGFESTIGYDSKRLQRSFRLVLKKYFPKIYNLLVRYKTKYYLIKVASYEKTTSKHMFE